MIPVNIITGFLGSGKTTLLRGILQDQRFANTAVIVNEFGEIGLDHILLEEVEEGILLLESGCICCTIRSDLQDTIRSLQKRVAEGVIAPFDRLAIETTGVADPAPIISTLTADPLLRSQFRLGNIVCMIDGIAGLNSLAHQPEVEKQAAIADRLLISKTDIANQAEIRELEHRLKQLNPVAALSHATGSDFDVTQLIDEDLGNAEQRFREISRWIARTHPKPHHHEPHGDHAHSSHGHLLSFVLNYETPIDWVAFGIWLTALLHAHGERILRVKGILNVKESKTPVIIHGVQHVVHPPMHLDRWPDEKRLSGIVFITRGIPESTIRASLSAFLGVADNIRQD